jgi:lipoprotein-anchoring transpeptidase ErfK/SrfK
MAGGRKHIVSALIAGALALAACGGSSSGDDTRAGNRERPTPEAPDRTTTTEAAAPASSGVEVAQAIGGSVQVYASPSEAEPTVALDNPNENGAPLVFLVEDNQGEWLNVLLPVRPNGSTGWIRAADVTLAANPYSIDIGLAEHRLVVHSGDEVVVDVAIGVGTASTPTPGGKYYIKELLQPPDPTGSYGPYAYGLSGYSNVLEEFNGGNGVIGIHGTNEPELIGTDVSHGCIRMDNDTITHLAGILPLGTPVHIAA